MEPLLIQFMRMFLHGSARLQKPAWQLMVGVFTGGLG
jgi:hypothetical protein